MLSLRYGADQGLKAGSDHLNAIKGVLSSLCIYCPALLPVIDLTNPVYMA